MPHKPPEFVLKLSLDAPRPSLDQRLIMLFGMHRNAHLKQRDRGNGDPNARVRVKIEDSFGLCVLVAYPLKEQLGLVTCFQAVQAGHSPIGELNSLARCLQQIVQYIAQRAYHREVDVSCFAGVPSPSHQITSLRENEESTILLVDEVVMKTSKDVLQSGSWLKNVPLLQITFAILDACVNRMDGATGHLTFC